MNNLEICVNNFPGQMLLQFGHDLDNRDQLKFDYKEAGCYECNGDNESCSNYVGTLTASARLKHNRANMYEDELNGVYY